MTKDSKPPDGETEESVIRRLDLRRSPKAIPIHLHAGNPIDPDWAAIVHARARHPRKADFDESFNLSFFMFDGELITYEQFETLEIALDQASAIAGIKKSEWESCQVRVTSADGKIPWDPKRC